MVYVLIFITGCLLIKISKLKKEIMIYKNNYYTALKILEDYDPKLKEYLNKNQEKN